VLAVVFAAAGVGKLIDRAGTRQSVSEFGAPERLAWPLALILPTAELAVAVALLLASTRLVGAVAALGLLGVFSAAIGVSLVRGRSPDCHCFGVLHSAPAGWRTVVRNGVFAGLAIAVVVAGGHGPSAFGWVGGLAPAEILALTMGVVLIALAVGGGLAFVSLLRAHGRVLLRLDTVEGALREAGIRVGESNPPPGLGIDPGTPAPPFIAETATGARVSLDDLLEPGLPLLLLFTSPNCGPCQALLPALARWQHEYAAGLTLAAVSSGERAAIRAEAEQHGLERVLVDDDLAVYAAYQANGTPGAVLISADGQIASYVASGAEEIEQLVERALNGEQERDGLAIGAPAPELDLRDLEGRAVSLADPAGRDTLVVFWNAGCGFCSSIRDELHAWEQHAAGGALRLLVVSSGDPDESRADGFRSPVVLDPDYTASAAFGANGTPMAVLVNREGRVASTLVGGGAAVLALATNHDARTKATQ
jgi:peroxiredoxin